MGVGLKSFGRYDEALDHLQKTSAAFPRDRVVLNAIGRIFFLKRRFADSVAAFRKTLLVDPEDLAAHYNLMLAYRGLHDEEKAKVHESLYLRFKADETSQFLTQAFRLLNPDDNRERQPVHEHDSTWTPEALEAASMYHHGRPRPLLAAAPAVTNPSKTGSGTVSSGETVPDPVSPVSRTGERR